MAADTGWRAAPRVPGIAQSAPAFEMPAGACDCHLHIFDRPERFAMAPGRPYTPQPALVEDALDLHRALGLSRVVIVQPTVYGTDNACTASAIDRLNASGHAARGIAVVDASMPQDQLHRLHDGGIRGLRLNLVSRNVTPAAVADLLQAAARIAAPLGWHLQTYAPLSLIASVRDAIAALPVHLVVDHFGRPRAADGIAQAGFDALLSLVNSGKVYVKLSAAYRVSERDDYADAAPLARALIDANSDRMLWGSDWPHIAERPHGAAPRQPGELEPFRQEDGGAALNRLMEWAGTAATIRKILVENPARLYRF